MSKIKGEIILKNKEEKEKNIINFKGIYTNNHISYKENDILVTIDIMNNKIVMKRVASDYEAILSLILNKTTKNKYNIKNVGCVILNIKTLKLNIDNNCIDIEYLVIDSNETFSYRINYELMEE